MAAQIKSDNTNLTLNADGSGNDIKFQSNAVEKASISDAGLLTTAAINVTGTVDNTISGTLVVKGGLSANQTSALTLFQQNSTHSTIKAFGADGSTTGILNTYVCTSDGSPDTLVTSVTADGLTFNGDTAAANALDDYETGDFTITLSSGATTTPTYTGCRYTKIGNIVHVDVGIGFAGITCDATAIQVTGLPFAPVNRILVPANCYQRVNFDSAKNQFWYIEAASTTLDLKEATTNTNSVSTVPSQSGSFSPLFDSISFSYRAD